MRPLLIAMLVAASLAGCAPFRPKIEAQVPQTAEKLATSTDAGSDSSLDVQVEAMSKSALIISRQHKSEPVPDAKISKLSITESSVYDAMQMLAEAGGLGLSITGGAKGTEKYGSVAMFNISGSLKVVLERVSKQLGFFYRVEDGMLVVDQEQKFAIELPPILLDDALAGMTNSLQSLGAREVYLDRGARTLTFTANRKGLGDVESFLEKVRESRSMIVYQISVFQVDLTDASSKGINWSGLIVNKQMPFGQLALDLVNPVATAESALKMGLVFGGGEAGLEAVAKFLETQGTVKIITQPRLTVMNGAKSKLFVGNAMTFVSKVGSNFSTGLNQVTAETSTLQTGVSLEVTGDFHDGTVYTQIGLDISDLVSMSSFSASGVELKLPNTTKRQVENLSRAKPGQTILLGGITINRDTFGNSNGIYGVSKNSDAQRSELVLAIRPKVVTFSAQVAPVAQPKSEK